MSNFFEEINNNNVRTISNGGTDNIRGYSNQCMLISILDYLRYVTKQLPKSTSIADFRRDNNINESNWSQNSEFNYENRSQMAILRAIAVRYNLTLHIKYLNRNNRGVEYIGNVAYEIGNGNGSQIVPILAFGNHFQLIIENESVLSRDIIDTKLSRHYKAHYFNQQTQEYENLDNITNENDKYIKEFEIYGTLIKDLQARLVGNTKENIDNQITELYKSLDTSPDPEIIHGRIISLQNIQEQFIQLDQLVKQFNDLAKKIDANVLAPSKPSNKPDTSSKPYASSKPNASSKTKPYASSKSYTSTASSKPYASSKPNASSKPYASNASSKPYTSNASSKPYASNASNASNASSNPSASKFILAMEERQKSSSGDINNTLTRIDYLNNELVRIKNEMPKSKTNQYLQYLEMQERNTQLELDELQELVNKSFKQKYLKYKQKYLQLKNRNKSIYN